MGKAHKGLLHALLVADGKAADNQVEPSAVVCICLHDLLKCLHGVLQAKRSSCQRTLCLFVMSHSEGHATNTALTTQQSQCHLPEAQARSGLG